MDRGKILNHMGALITLEVILIVLTVLTFVLPIQDYALREYRDWSSSRSPEAWKAFQDKKEKEFEIRVGTGCFFALASAGLGLFISRKRSGPS
jgi:hypothetical protein